MPTSDNPLMAAKALPAGYRFSEFEIQHVIGGGGFGIVYRAFDHQLQRTIAIKEFMPVSLAVRDDDMKLVLRSERLSKTFQAGLSSFIQEARLLARFNHPNLLHVLRFWVQNDTAYIAMQFYGGCSLSLLQAQQPLLINEAWIRGMLPSLLDAIALIHRDGYLHRDISLENIQIQQDQSPVLLDFGSARQTIGNLSDETETMLRPGFAPIEQYSDNNDGEQGPWTDIYALGAVLHTLITGSPPQVSVVRSIEDSYQPLNQLRPAGYSLPLLQAIDCALALKAEDRPQTIEQFAAMLALSAPETLPSQPPEHAPAPSLAPVIASAASPAASCIRRFPRSVKTPALLVTAGVLGIFSGVMISRSGPERPYLPASAAEQSSQQALSAPASVPSPEASAPEAIAQVYIRLAAGDEVWLNGSPQALAPAANGFARLPLPPGEYLFRIASQERVREQKITVDREGTWLLIPHT